MASQTALVLVNRVLSLTSDYAPLTTVVGSPAGIAERIINFLNLVIADVGRVMDMPILASELNGTTTGVDGLYIVSAGGTEASDSIVSVSVNGIPLEEVSVAQMQMHKGNKVGGLSQFFTRSRLSTGELQIEVFPVPVTNLPVVVSSFNNPSELTVLDTATTELTGFDDVLVTGALAHMDAHDGMNRGYNTKYEALKNKLFVHLNRNKQIRIQPESYT